MENIYIANDSMYRTKAGPSTPLDRLKNVTTDPNNIANEYTAENFNNPECVISNECTDGITHKHIPSVHDEKMSPKMVLEIFLSIPCSIRLR